MLKLAGKQIEMDRILTETDSIDEISCLFDYFTYLQRKVTRQKQVGFGRKPNRIFKFLGKHEGGKQAGFGFKQWQFGYIQNMNETASVTNKKLAESLIIQGKSGKISSFRLCDKGNACKACKPVFFMVWFPWIRIPILKWFKTSESPGM